MSFGWANSWYSGLATDLDGKYATAVGHTIESTIDYIKPWPTGTNTPADWIARFNNNPSQLRPFYFDLMVPWATAAVPKRDMQITVDIAPHEFSYSAAPGEIAAWHTDMNAGVWDNAWIAFANMVVGAGLANAHIRPFHEPETWNYWDAGTDYTGWLSAFNRMIGVFRAHGLTGRMGPHWSQTTKTTLTTSSWPGSDCTYYDTYGGPSGSNPTDLNNWAVSCRSKGLMIAFGELGLNPGSTEADGITFLTFIHDWIQANPDVYDSIMFYNSNGSVDITNGSYPTTLAYLRNNMATWEISAGTAPGGGGTTGSNTAGVTGSGSTAHFSGTSASNVLNVTIYRDTFGGTKIADVTPSAGVWSYDKTSETNGAHVYVIAMFDSAALTPGNTVFGPQTFNLTIDSTVATSITDRSTVVTATDTNGGSLNINWPSGGSAPHSGDVAILAVAVGSGGVVNTPTGFTLYGRYDNSTQVGVIIYTKVCSGSETGAIAVTANFGLMHLVLNVKIGVDNTTPIDVASTASTVTGGTTITLPSVVTTKANALLMGYAFAVNYPSATAFTWTPPSGMTETVDVFGTESGLYGKGLEVSTLLETTAGATGAKIATASTGFSYGVGVAIAIRPAAIAVPAESISSISVVKDLGVVSVVAGVVTSGIATVKVFEGGVLQGSGPNVGSAASVGLSAQSVGAHSDVAYGYDALDVQVAGPVTVPTFTVLDAPLITGTAATLNNVRITGNAVTTTIRVYEIITAGGVLVDSHAVDSALGWDFTTLTAGHSYDATALDGTHESAKVRFTTVVAPGTTSIESVDVSSTGTVLVVWAGLSIRLFDVNGALIETVLASSTTATGGTTVTGDTLYLYTVAPADGKYTVTAYDTADPAAATASDTAAFAVGTLSEHVAIHATSTKLLKGNGHFLKI